MDEVRREPSKPSILLVDDLPSGLLSLEAMLGEFGLNLVKAGSGKEALRQVMAHDFAVMASRAENHPARLKLHDEGE